MRPKKLPVLGELELAVLDHIWRNTDADVQEVHAMIGAARGITANTVGSAMERLCRKGLLLRDKVSHAYRYRAAMDQETFRAQTVIDAGGGAQQLKEAGFLAAFVDVVAEADGDALLELERLILLKKGARRREP